MASTLSVTLASRNMEASEEFYDLFGLTKLDTNNPYYITYSVVPGFNINLQETATDEVNAKSWGKVEIGVRDVESFYNRLVTSGFKPEYSPHVDAQGATVTKSFQIRDPTGNEMRIFEL